MNNSMVSVGTERMVVESAEKNLFEKARSRLDLVRQTVEKAQREGALATAGAVRNRLSQPLALGYSCSGLVIDIGADVMGFQIGDRVACAGGGYAVHAEVVAVPKNLVVKLPEDVDFEAAAFTTLGAIALQGIRLAELKLGEVAAVIGLGLLGQITVQMLKAAGCMVIGMDLRSDRVDLALQSGIDAATIGDGELKQMCEKRTDGHGVDAVIIAADTKSNAPVEYAGLIARKKGVVVAVGAVGMDIPRKVYYEKELDFRISSSYGPGRYDPLYEEKGNDYPYAYVRWTEKRNMQAFVQMTSEGSIDFLPLITHRFPISEAPKAYELITGKTNEPFLGVLLTYTQDVDPAREIMLIEQPLTASSMNNDTQALRQVRLGVFGAGNFANATILPVIKKLDSVELEGIASSGGLSARSTADRFGFSYCTTDDQALLGDDRVNAVAILTRHHLHASQAIAALQAGKHVFVEKPLCISEEELQWITKSYAETRALPQPPNLMVGFNRRFAPFIKTLKQHLSDIGEPLMMHYRVNAGYIAQEHWTQDPQQGGGRLIGEGVHFIDLLIFLAGEQPLEVTTKALPDSGRYSQDNFVITMEFGSGSLGTVSYVANGSNRLGKEFLEVFGGGLAARLDDYRSLVVRRGERQVKERAWLRQDKGHKAEWVAWTNYLLGKGKAPMTFDDIVISTKASLAAQRSLRENRSVLLAEIQGTSPESDIHNKPSNKEAD